MGKDAVEGNLVQQLRDIKRRISALERQQQDVGDLSEIAGSLTMGDGAVIIDNNGIGIVTNSSAGFESKYGISWFKATDLTAIGTKIYSYTTSGNPHLVVDGDGTYIDLGPSTVEVSGNFLVSGDAEITGSLNMNAQAIKGGNQTITDDGVYSFTPNCARGVLILRGLGAGSTEYAMVTYAAVAGTAYAYAWVNGTNTVITTGALTGTTGTDGKLTISAHTDGNIYIENRRGGSRAVAWNILAGV